MTIDVPVGKDKPVDPSSLLTLLAFGTQTLTAWMFVIDLMVLVVVFSSAHLRKIMWRNKNG